MANKDTKYNNDKSHKKRTRAKISVENVKLKYLLLLAAEVKKNFFLFIRTVTSHDIIAFRLNLTFIQSLSGDV